MPGTVGPVEVEVLAWRFPGILKLGELDFLFFSVAARPSFSEHCNQAELQKRAQTEWFEEKPFGPLDGRRDKVRGREGLHMHRSYSEQAYHKSM